MSQEMSAPNDPSRPTGSDCERVLALIPAYSIGATDPDDEAFVKSKLAECPEAASELAGYMKLAESMYYSAPPTPVPSSLVTTWA